MAGAIIFGIIIKTARGAFTVSPEKIGPDYNCLIRLVGHRGAFKDQFPYPVPPH